MSFCLLRLKTPLAEIRRWQGDEIIKAWMDLFQCSALEVLRCGFFCLWIWIVCCCFCLFDCFQAVSACYFPLLTSYFPCLITSYDYERWQWAGEGKASAPLSSEHPLKELFKKMFCSDQLTSWASPGKASSNCRLWLLPPKARCPKVKAEISYQGSTGHLCQRRVQGCFEAQMLCQAVHAVLPPLHTPSRSVLDRQFQFLLSFMWMQEVTEEGSRVTLLFQVILLTDLQFQRSFPFLVRYITRESFVLYVAWRPTHRPGKLLCRFRGYFLKRGKIIKIKSGFTCFLHSWRFRK